MPRAVTLILNSKQSEQKAAVLDEPVTIESLRRASANKMRTKASRFFDAEDGTDLTTLDEIPATVRKILVSKGEEYVGGGAANVQPTVVSTAPCSAAARAATAASAAPAAATGAAPAAIEPSSADVPAPLRTEELLLPGEKGAICWVPVGGGRMALWHKPGGKAMPKLRAAGATMVATLLCESEGAELIGHKAREAGLEWHWTDLQHANTDYLRTDEAVDKMAAAVAAIRAALGRGGNVLVHCSAGIHRTGTVGYAVLRASGWTRGEALTGLHQLRIATAEGVDKVGAGNAHGSGRLEIAETILLPRVSGSGRVEA